MSKTYMSRYRTQSSSKAKQTPRLKVSGPSLDALKGGAMPSQEQIGHRVNLPEAIRTKMESSFGMDFSDVQLYESQTVADAGAKAVTMGNKISFAPGRLNLSSKNGQTILGHELSHVASQARGEVSGRGFLADHALEARANREGAMSVDGKTVYAGPVTPISATSTALSAAGPMQAGKDEEEDQAAVLAKRAAAKTKMSQATQNLTPLLRESVKNATSSSRDDYDERGLLKVTSGSRWTYMRGNNNAGMREYTTALKASNQEVNKRVRAGRYRNLSHLKNQGYKSFLSPDEHRGAKATESADALAYQERALQNLQEFLAAMSEDETAMQALRESANMYSSLGTFGQRNADGTLNTTGMNNGKEEALNRAMNDILLRAYTSDTAVTQMPYATAETDKDKKKVLKEMQKQFGTNITAEDLSRAKEVDVALMAMQSKVMNRSVTGNTDELTEYEMGLRNMLNEFYIANGLMGIKTSNDSFHTAAAQQRAVAGARAGNFDLNSALDNDAMMLELERKIKHPDPNEDPKERQARIKLYMTLKKGRVDWDSSREYK